MSLVFLVLIAGCAEKKQELEPVTLKLKWLHQAQFAGNYAAKDKGFYKEAGLDVDIQEFSYENPTIDAVALGEADFGITGADELMIARSEGKKLKALAVIYKVNPVCAYSLKESNISKPHDLIGKTVGIERAADGTDINIGILYYAMMARLGIDRSLIDEITIGYDASELLEGKTDVSTGYIINEPYQAIEAGHEVNIILMAEYGVNIYADVLFTTDEMIEKKPQTVKRFVKATLEGWHYAIENIDEAVDITLRYAPEKTKNHEYYMLSESIPLIHTGKGRVGMMDEREWQKVKDILHEHGILKNPVDINDAFTVEFISSD